MARYFAANTLSSFNVFSPPDSGHSTSTSTFDSNYVSNSIAIGGYAGMSTPVLPVTGPTLWVRFTMNAGYSYSNIIPLEFYNGGNRAYRLTTGNSGSAWQFQRWNGTAWVNVGTAMGDLGVGSLRVWVLRLDFASGLELWINGNTVVSATGMGGGEPKIDTIHFRAIGAQTAYYSEIMVADHDLRENHYMCKRPVGAGFYNDGSGTFADVDDTSINDSDVVILPNSGSRKLFTHPGITVPSGYRIVAASVGGRARRSGTVTDGKLLVRSGTTDSAGSGLGLGVSFEPRCRVLDLDPATSGSFTQSSFNALQFGLEAV